MQLRSSLQMHGLTLILGALFCCPFESSAVYVRGGVTNTSQVVVTSVAERQGPPPERPATKRDLIGKDGAGQGTGGLPLPGDLDDLVVVWPDASTFSFPLETLIAFVWITMVAMLPIIVIKLEGKNLTQTQLVLFGVMWFVFFGGVYLFTNVLLFQSAHFTRTRCLTIVEAVYFMSQILTTVGYGDITPAKENGQVFVAFYVLFSLMIIANVITEVSNIVSERSKHWADHLMDEDTKKNLRVTLKNKRSATRSDTASFESEKALVEETNTTPRIFRADFVGEAAEAPELDFTDLITAGLTYAMFAVVGTLFFHYYPGEGKTVFQGVYMSVITLSTVGFGAFTPTTDFGKVFAAFWMLFGSASLVAVIGAFSELKEQMKMRERWNKEKVRDEMKQFLKDAPDQMNKYDFVTRVLLHRNLVNERELSDLARFFEGQQSQSGMLSKAQLKDAMDSLVTPRPPSPTTY